MLECMKGRPALPGQSEPVQVTGESLNAVGVNGAAFGFNSGDTVKFVDETPVVVCQPINKDANAPKAYYVGVERNGKSSWLSIGSLTRRDINGEGIDDFRKENLKKANFLDIYSSLHGKTLKAGNMMTIKVAKFDNGRRVEGESIEKSYAEVTVK